MWVHLQSHQEEAEDLLLSHGHFGNKVFLEKLPIPLQFLDDKEIRFFLIFFLYFIIFEPFHQMEYPIFSIPLYIALQIKLQNPSILTYLLIDCTMLIQNHLTNITSHQVYRWKLIIKFKYLQSIHFYLIVNFFMYFKRKDFYFT